LGGPLVFIFRGNIGGAALGAGEGVFVGFVNRARNRKAESAPGGAPGGGGGAGRVFRTGDTLPFLGEKNKGGA